MKANRKPEQLFDDGLLRIRAVKGTSSRLIVVIGATLIGEGRNQKPLFDLKASDGEKEHFLFIKNRKLDWFSKRDHVAAIRQTVSQYANNNNINEIVSFGVSMGGYGAILLSDRRMRTVVAVNPQISMHPDIVGAVPKHRLRISFRGFSPPTGPDLPRSAAEIMARSKVTYLITFGDVEYLDRFQRRLVPELPNVHVFTVRGADHSLWTDICNSGLAHDFLRACFSANIENVEKLCRQIEQGIASGELDRARRRGWAAVLSARLRRKSRKFRSCLWEFFD